MCPTSMRESQRHDDSIEVTFADSALGEMSANVQTKYAEFCLLQAATAISVAMCAHRPAAQLRER